MKEVNLSDFIENPDNPRKITDEAFDRLVGKLRRVPEGLLAMRIAYVTDHPAGRFVVISGNTRLRAIKKIMGESATAPCEWFQDVTHMTEEQRREFIVAANKNDGEWDVEQLLSQYGKDDLSKVFSEQEIESLIENFSIVNQSDVSSHGNTDDDDVPNDDNEIFSKRGEVYECGNVRLMCGDTSISHHVDFLMREDRADMVFTDPPYGVAIGSKNKVLNTVAKGWRCQIDIEGDAIDKEDLSKMLISSFQNLRTNCKEDASYYVTAPQGGDLFMMMMMMRDAGLDVRHVLIWVKNRATFSLGRLDYDYKHEPILYTWTKSHHNYRGGENRTSVWNYDNPISSKLHPTMKPVCLVENAILDSTKENDIVLDGFGGSGTTGVACVKHNRRCRIMEVDPKYCDVIRKRIAEYVQGTGCDWMSVFPRVETFNGK